MAARGEATRARILESAEALILAKGYTGMTLDDVLTETGLTKGAFFHHFKGKAELARAVVERYAAEDFRLFAEMAEKADRLADDPYDRVMIFLRLFEAFLDDLGKPFAGCVYASYTYERRQFGAEMHAFIRERLEAWIGQYQAKLDALIAARPPSRPVTARALAEMIVTIVEGGFVMGNALADPGWLQRQSAEYRGYLKLLFGGGRSPAPQ